MKRSSTECRYSSLRALRGGGEAVPVPEKDSIDDRADDGQPRYAARMPLPGQESAELLELQRRGLELAMQEAEARRAEIEAILSSRPVIQAAEAQPIVRETRLAILEELTHAAYPSATVLAAARHLAVEARLGSGPRSGRIPLMRRAHRQWRLFGAAIWGAVFALLVSGTGESAVGAHFTSTKLLVWGVFVVASGGIAVVSARWPRWRARAAYHGTASPPLVTSREVSRLFRQA